MTRQHVDQSNSVPSDFDFVGCDPLNPKRCNFYGAAFLILRCVTLVNFSNSLPLAFRLFSQNYLFIFLIAYNLLVYLKFHF